MSTAPLTNSDERTAIRSRLKSLYKEQEAEIRVHNQASVRIDTAIFELKQRLAVVDSISLDEERSSINMPYRPKTYKQFVCHCLNLKCRKKIYFGQDAVKYGSLGLCCTFKCLAETMAAGGIADD